ncbi:MAG TPA: nuclease-related domain-containing protein [Patescibacteria group bacterium]|nr:nuclease-related domain-containing protein [Patescibacteria group bacterium]
MIVKEAEPLVSTDKREVAGRQAENQLAFYLKRAFERDPLVRVFNSLRLERPDDAAQIDHLILHRWGFVLIESKSVHDSIEINPHGEFSRWYDGHRHGMASPIEQVKRQEEFLRDYLHDHRELVIGKILGLMQQGFSGRAWDHFVAISDQGRIEMKPASTPRPDCLHKAEAIVEQVRALLQDYGSLRQKLIGTAPRFSDETLDSISYFLCDHHRPLGLVKAPPAAVVHLPPPVLPPKPFTFPQPSVPVAPVAPVSPVVAVPPSSPACGKCGSAKVTVEFGRSYYLKCHDCGGNTAIHETCACSGKERLSKRGDSFTATCAVCGKVRLYHVNTPMPA